jgi:hypothetical protein
VSGADDGRWPGRSTPWFALVALLVVCYSLVFRALGRGDEYPGWDLIGPAHGLHLLSTKPVLEAAREVLGSVRAFQYWTSKDSLVYTLVPGALGRWWPWPHWVHLLTLVLFLAALGFAARAADLRLRDAWIVLLAWGASPALLSFAIAGPFISACLPHALALTLVTVPGLRRRPLLSLGLALVVVELSWHLYLTGRTVFVVLLLAAALERAAPARTRLAWLAAAVLQAALVLRFSGQIENDLLAFDALAGRDLPGAALDLMGALLLELDSPVLWLLAVVCFAFLRRRRGLLLALFAGHLGLLLLLATFGAEKLLTRRFLLVDFYALVTVATVFGESTGPRRALRPLIVLALLAGNVWQVIGLHAFYASSPSQRDRQTLPFVQARGDYVVHPELTAAAREVQAWVESGGGAVLLYGLSAYPENTTDPAGVLERLYVGLGHERFLSSVFVFGAVRCRYDCLPVRPLDDAARVLEDLRLGRGPAGPDRLRLYHVWGERSEAALQENATVFAELRRRFFVRPDGFSFGAFRRARLDPALGVTAPLLVNPEAAVYAPIRVASARREAPELLHFPLDLAWLPSASRQGLYSGAGPFGKRAFSLRWEATVTACESRRYEWLVGVAGEVAVRLDGEEVLRMVDPSFRLATRALPLTAGRHRLDVEYATRPGFARLLLDVRAAPGEPWAAGEPGLCPAPAEGAREGSVQSH